MPDHTSGARTGDFMNGAGNGHQTHTTSRSVVFNEQTLADSEHTLADSDQTLSDSDQTSA